MLYALYYLNKIGAKTVFLPCLILHATRGYCSYNSDLMTCNIPSFHGTQKSKHVSHELSMFVFKFVSLFRIKQQFSRRCNAG